MQMGKRSWIFENKPSLIAGSAVGAEMEKHGAMPQAFDYFFADMRAGEDSFEKAERAFLKKACQLALAKASIKESELDFFLAGDLMNQIVSSSYTARDFSCGYLGQFGACSTSAQTLLLGAALINGGLAKKILCATVSHNGTAEKQFRFPNEYGIQKPDYAQFTASAAGAGILSSEPGLVKLSAATIGRVVDYGIGDPFNMGAAMAPAAFDSLKTHFDECKLPLDYYDLIITGDLGRVGQACLIEMLKKDKFALDIRRLQDCGVLIYGADQQVFAGGSGCGCSASLFYGHFLPMLQRGELQRVLLVATGALMSPLCLQQKESIPCIAHCISAESVR